MYAQVGNTALPWLGYLLLVDEEIGNILSFVMVLSFFAVEGMVSFLLAGYLQSSEKRDEFCFWIQRDLFAGTDTFTAQAGSDQQDLLCLLATWQDQAGPQVLPAGVCLTSLIEIGSVDSATCPIATGDYCNPRPPLS